MSLQDYLHVIAQRKAEREANIRRRVEEYQKAQRRREYMKLKREFEDE